LTSISIEEYETEWLIQSSDGGNNKRYSNIGDEALANLDEKGVVVVGAEVSPNDILVGKSHKRRNRVDS